MGLIFNVASHAMASSSRDDQSNRMKCHSVVNYSADYIVAVSSNISFLSDANCQQSNCVFARETLPWFDKATAKCTSVEMEGNFKSVRGIIQFNFPTFKLQILKRFQCWVHEYVSLNTNTINRLNRHSDRSERTKLFECLPLKCGSLQ